MKFGHAPFLEASPLVTIETLSTAYISGSALVALFLLGGPLLFSHEFYQRYRHFVVDPLSECLFRFFVVDFSSIHPLQPERSTAHFWYWATDFCWVTRCACQRYEGYHCGGLFCVIFPAAMTVMSASSRLKCGGISLETLVSWAMQMFSI